MGVGGSTRGLGGNHTSRRRHLGCTAFEPPAFGAAERRRATAGRGLRFLQVRTYALSTEKLWLDTCFFPRRVESVRGIT